jgi:hypothetical protein
VLEALREAYETMDWREQALTRIAGRLPSATACKAD